MAGKTYVTKGYSTYTNIPSRQGGYDHGPKNPVNQYAAEPKTIERVRAPASGYNDFVGSPSKVELLNEYVHSPTMSGSPIYAPMNNYEDREVSYGFNYENSSPPKYQAQNPTSPNKNPFSRPVQGYHSDESNKIHSGPGLGGARNVRTGNISSPIEDSVYYSPRADPRRRGVLDDLSTRAQPLEPQTRYARPAFVAKPNTNRHHFTGSAIDSHEAMRKYRGSRVP